MLTASIGPPPAVGVVHAELDLIGCVGLRCRDVERVQRARAVLRMDEVERVRADERVGVEPEDALDRGARVGEVPVRVDDRHDVARVAHHGAEASLVPLEELGDPVHGGLGSRPTLFMETHGEHDDTRERREHQDGVRLH